MRREIRVRAWGYVAFFWLVALAVSGSAVAGLALDWSPSWAAVTFIIVPLGLALRGLRCSVAVSADEVVVRNLIRTYRLPRGLVTDVSPCSYDGFWVRGSESALFSAVSVTAGGKSYKAYGLLGRQHAVVRAVERLRRLVGLPERSHGAPARHGDRY